MIRDPKSMSGIQREELRQRYPKLVEELTKLDSKIFVLWNQETVPPETIFLQLLSNKIAGMYLWEHEKGDMSFTMALIATVVFLSEEVKRYEANL